MLRTVAPEATALKSADLSSVDRMDAELARASLPAGWSKAILESATIDPRLWRA